MNIDYSQFYRGTTNIPSYGNGTYKKDTLVKYEFNTTDEHGNKVMDKMSREETLQTIKDISSLYGDAVIVEFSGDGMAALVENKKGILDADVTQEQREAMDARNAAFQKEITQVDMMRTMDSSAYTYGNVKDENVKSSKNSEKKVEEVSDSQNVSAKDKTADYYDYLKKKYDCVKKGSVALSDAYVKECANNPQKAKELEENLDFFKQSYESGYQNAKANAQAIGARLVKHTESWSIDSTGNVTMVAETTVTSDTGVKSWKELQEERQEKLKEKKAEEKKQEERLQEKKEEQERIDAEKVDVYHKAIDISV